MITVIDAMNGMGQDWECSEVLRAEVRRLIDAREERERQYRREWDGLRERLAAAEQRATDAEARMVDAYRLVDEVMHLADRALYSDDPAERMEKAGQLQTLWNLTLQEALAATAPATQPDERAAAEREVIEQAREVLSLMPNIANSDVWKSTPDGDPCIPWTIHAVTILAIDDLRDALLVLDAMDGAAKEEA